MKRFLSLLSLVLLTSGLLPTPTSFATASYSGADNANDYAYSVVQNTSSVLTEKTTAARNSTTGDVTLYKAAGSELYIGYSGEFDGISASVYTAASSGAYSVKYWDGSSWTSLVSSTSASIANSTDGTFQIEWDRPSNWASKNILMNTDEDGNSNQYTGAYYFVKVVIESAYTSSPVFSQVGIINYNLKVNVEDQFGDTPSSYTSSYAFSASGADATVYVSKNDGNGTEYYGFYAPLAGKTYSYTATVSGFVQESGSLTINHSQTTLNLSLDYTHKLYAQNSSTGNQVTINSAYAGTDDTTCTIQSGIAYCAVPTSEDGDTATVSASGYTTKTVSIPDRTSDSTAQQTTYVSMTSSGSSGNPDLTVDDLYFSGSTLWADISNEGDEDVSSSDTVYVAVYVDGDRDYYGTLNYSYFDSGESNAFSFLSGNFDSGETYDIEVCIDDSDNVDESDEDNNCREENLTRSSSSSSDPDLTVDDLYLSGDDLKVDLSNEGDEDVSSSDTIYMYVYVDGDREDSSTISYSYFDAGESNTFTALSNYFDSNDSYEVEVCIDAKDDVNESDEDNNCRTETLGDTGNNQPDLDVTDIYLDNDDLYFTVKNRGDDDVDNGDSVKIEVSVDGDVQYTKTVTQSSSSTNFLDEGEDDTYNAGGILDNEGSTYDVEVCVDTEDDVDESSESNNCMSVDEDSIGDGPSSNNDSSCGDFRDLSSHWSEEYVCDLYDRDVVSGRSDYYFSPNSSTTRAEFLKMVLLDAELDPYSVSSVHYTDVDSNDWYYSYVTYATAMGYVDGYSNGSFGPNETINRAEALVILMRVADQTNYSFDASDIDFSDVERSDWFAYAVVIADEDNIVDGYSNGTFGPNNNITRGEAAKILDLAYDEYFN